MTFVEYGEDRPGSYCAGCLAEGAINCPRCKEGSRAVAHYGIPRLHDELHKITKICKKEKLRKQGGLK